VFKVKGLGCPGLNRRVVDDLSFQPVQACRKERCSKE
jgi:hypothetical protein